MRLIDVCIPKFDAGSESDIRSAPPPVASPNGFQLASGLFGPTEREYNVDEDDDNDADDGSSYREDIFFEAEDGTSQVISISSQMSL